MRAELRKHLSTKHMVCNLSPVPPGDESLCSSTNVAGWTYCGVGVMKLLGRLPSWGDEEKDDDLTKNLLRWLVSRQTLYLKDDEDLTVAEDEPEKAVVEFLPPSFQVQGAHPVSAMDVANEVGLFPDFAAEDLSCAGFNGRCNKVADTCYAFWVGASLEVCTHMKCEVTPLLSWSDLLV